MTGLGGITLKQKIDSALMWRRRTKKDLCRETGVTRGRIDRCDGGGGVLTCAELAAIAGFLGAKLQVALRFPDGQELVREIATDDPNVSVREWEIGEIFGAKCEVEFVMEDIGKVV